MEIVIRLLRLQSLYVVDPLSSVSSIRLERSYAIEHTFSRFWSCTAREVEICIRTKSCCFCMLSLRRMRRLIPLPSRVSIARLIVSFDVLQRIGLCVELVAYTVVE